MSKSHDNCSQSSISFSQSCLVITILHVVLTILFLTYKSWGLTNNLISHAQNLISHAHNHVSCSQSYFSCYISTNLRVSIVNPPIFLFANLNSPNIFLFQLVQKLFAVNSAKILMKVAENPFFIMQMVLPAKGLPCSPCLGLQHLAYWC